MMLHINKFRYCNLRHISTSHIKQNHHENRGCLTRKHKSSDYDQMLKSV